MDGSPPGCLPWRGNLIDVTFPGLETYWSIVEVEETFCSRFGPFRGPKRRTFYSNLWASGIVQFQNSPELVLNRMRWIWANNFTSAIREKATKED